MSISSKIYPIFSKPGIKRDGTNFEGDYYTDGQWVRWQRSLPRKIGGYLKAGNAIDIARGCNVFTQNGVAYLHYGTKNFTMLGQMNVVTGQIYNTVNRTSPDFVPNANNLFQISPMYDAGSTTTNIIVHAAPNLTNIDNDVTGAIFMGDVTSTDQLEKIDDSEVSGGIAILHPYLFYFGSNGFIGWSVPNQPSDLGGTGSGSGRATGGKILCGTQTRAGAGNAPAGLFWATDALIRVTFSGGDAVFNFDRIAESYSILSSQCVVEYDGVYYWIGTDRFLMYNGVIQEVQNDLNRNFFFDNLDMSQRQLVWGMKVAAYGEIWWFYPKNGATECNHAIIYNIREKTWYDTPIARSCGYSAEIFPRPIMFGTDLNLNGSTNVYTHETGTDAVIDGYNFAILSYFETCNFFSTIPVNSQLPFKDNNLELFRYEPDFVVSGEMRMQIWGRKYPQSVPVLMQEEFFNATTEKIDIKTQSRIQTMIFISNEAGGNYQMGSPLVLMNDGDRRPV